jgi:hypothetical protein
LFEHVRIKEICTSLKSAAKLSRQKCGNYSRFFESENPADVQFLRIGRTQIRALSTVLKKWKKDLRQIFFEGLQNNRVNAVTNN